MNADHPTDARPILVFATHNPHKVRELQEMLGDQYQIQSLTDIGCHEEIVEDAPTLEGPKSKRVMWSSTTDWIALRTTPGLKSRRLMAPLECSARDMPAPTVTPRAT